MISVMRRNPIHRTTATSRKMTQRTGRETTLGRLAFNTIHKPLIYITPIRVFGCSHRRVAASIHYRKGSNVFHREGRGLDMQRATRPAGLGYIVPRRLVLPSERGGGERQSRLLRIGTSIMTPFPAFPHSKGMNGERRMCCFYDNSSSSQNRAYPPHL